jgi:CHAT domain-containing protein/Tfp pilus assembly protein PilF
VVEQVAEHTQAQRAGVKPGDVLISWKQAGIQGKFKTPFDLSYSFFEQAPRGPLEIVALRGTERHSWVFQSDSWGIIVRPNFSDPLLPIYRRSQNLYAAGKLEEATSCIRAAALIAPEEERVWLRPWLLAHAGKMLREAKQWESSDALYREAIESANSGPAIRAELLQQRAVGFEARQDLKNAAKSYNDALLESQKWGRETMTGANDLLSLGLVELKRNNLEPAAGYLRRALRIAETLAPDSLQNLLIIANLAVVYQDQGQFEKAEEFYLKALDKAEKNFPHSAHLEGTLNDLGVLFEQQGGFVRAEAYQRRALSVAQHLDPESLDVSDILFNLAECLVEEGRPAKAELYQKRALSIREKLVDNPLPWAYSLAGLGKIARIRGDLTKAEAYYRQALTMTANRGASERDRASFFIGLAAVLRDRSDFSQAGDLYRQALAVIEKEDPDSIDRATTLAELAGTEYRENRVDNAARLYRQALDLVESRAFQMRGLEDRRSRYRAEYTRYYQAYMRVLIEQGRTESAFEVLEGSRARTLFEMLARVHGGSDRVSRSADIERKRNLQRLLSEAAANRVRLLVGPHSEQQLGTLETETERLLLQYQQLDSQLRIGSSGYPVFVQPKKLGVADIRKLLDSRTLLLEYSLGEDKSYVWALSNHFFKPYALPARGLIETEARHVYKLLAVRNQTATKDDMEVAEKKYAAAAKKLSQMILGPVAKLLPGKRLVVVSDGALQFVPFSALPAPTHQANTVPLIVKHEIINLPSASVLAELRRQTIGRKKADKMVAILADPVFNLQDERLNSPSSRISLASVSPTQESKDLTRSAGDLGLTRNGSLYLSRLLYTRNEAEAVMSVTPPGQAMLAVDFDASRAMATSPILATYRIVHFATHGIVNNRHPELSGLVLSLVNKEGKPQDGFLKLQDIYNLKLPVDLVVLSGCQTGLGEQVNGEGVLGLTRGFMYAGATRVIASLWSVSDSATASLMAAFYEAMENDGMSPAAALRAAQIRMWKQKQWASPYYWAAFQLHGDWR